MDIDDFVSSRTLPDVLVDTNRALARTVQRGRTRRQRRFAIIAVGVAVAVAGIVATTLNIAGRDEPTQLSAGSRAGDQQRRSSAPVAKPHECKAKAGSPIDVAHEPDWRRYANYLPWTDRSGCLLRIDVVAERTGSPTPTSGAGGFMPNHCGWERARVLIVGQPLGTTYTNAANDIEYIRDPHGVFGRADLKAGFDPDATLPASAVDSGYRRANLELWHDPHDPSAIWMVSPNRTERWPAGKTPLCS